MKFTATIEMDNSAFDADPKAELRRILELLALRVKEQNVGVVFDSNGNAVGAWEIRGTR